MNSSKDCVDEIKDNKTDEVRIDIVDKANDNAIGEVLNETKTKLLKITEETLESLKDESVFKKELKMYLSMKKEIQQNRFSRFPSIYLTYFVVGIEYYFDKIMAIIYPKFLRPSLEQHLKYHAIRERYGMKKKIQDVDTILQKSAKLMKSDYFQNFIKITESLKKDEDDFKYDQLVCINLRSFSNYSTGRKTLYFLVCLKTYLNIKDCKVSSSNLTNEDIEILKKLDFKVIEYNDCVCCISIKNVFKLDFEKKKSLVYIPCLVDKMWHTAENILEQNWGLEPLKNLDIIGYSFNSLIRTVFLKISRPQQFLENDAYFVFNLLRKLKIVREQKIESNGDKAFDNTSIHRFDLSNANKEQLEKFSKAKDWFDKASCEERCVGHKITVDKILEEANAFEKSKRYKKFLKLLKKLKKKNFYVDFDQMVVYGLGNFQCNPRSLQQLYFIICLKKLLNLDVQAFDPAFQDNEKDILKDLNIKLIEENEKCKRKVENKKTLFFMVRLGWDLVNNIVRSNWNLESLSNLYMLTYNPHYFLEPISFYGDSFDDLDPYRKDTSHIRIATKILKIVKKEKIKPFNTHLGLEALYLTKFETTKITTDDLNKHFSSQLPAEYDGSFFEQYFDEECCRKNRTFYPFWSSILVFEVLIGLTLIIRKHFIN